MNDAVVHRGPDAHGVSLRGQVGLGHRRLSVIDLSHNADQPMARGSGCLVYSGEIYNFREVRGELEAMGKRFNTASDTEVLLEALNTWWIDALPRLNGMFAFAFHDEARRQVLIGRDRFGVKPVVFAKTDKRFYVASEAKQIFAAGEVRPRLNETEALGFLLDGTLNLGADTLFDAVTELRGGHYAVYDLPSGRCDTAVWYDVSARVTPMDVDYATACEMVGERLRDAVRSRLMTDVPLGACLSGGIDSSAICALSGGMVRDPAQFKVFTSFHPGPNYDERRFSRAVVEQFGFQSVEVQPDLNDLFSPGRLEEINYFQDQPVPSGSSYNEYIISKKARESGIKVLLDGQGADEYFGGYYEYKSLAQRDHLKRLDFAEFVRGIPLHGDAANGSIMHALKGLALDLSPTRRRGPKSAKADLARPEAVDAGNDFLALSLEQLVSTSLPHQLHYLDRNSMRWSVEARAPMTDYRLVELVLSLPTKYKVGRGFQKRILRDAVPYLPSIVARRSDKISYASPDADFMRRRPDVIRPLLAQALAYIGRLVPTGTAMTHFEAMIDGRVPYDPLYFRLLSFHGWAKAFGVEI